jgi:hypothetical protein
LWLPATCSSHSPHRVLDRRFPQTRRSPSSVRTLGENLRWEVEFGTGGKVPSWCHGKPPRGEDLVEM